MTVYQIVTIEDEIAYSEEFTEAKRKRKLSKIVNALLRSHFDVKKQSVPKDLMHIEDELRDIAARKALLMQRKEDAEKKSEEEKKRYEVIE